MLGGDGDLVGSDVTSQHSSLSSVATTKKPEWNGAEINELGVRLNGEMSSSVTIHVFVSDSMMGD